MIYYSCVQPHVDIQLELHLFPNVQPYQRRLSCSVCIDIILEKELLICHMLKFPVEKPAIFGNLPRLRTVHTIDMETPRYDFEMATQNHKLFPLEEIRCHFNTMDVLEFFFFGVLLDIPTLSIPISRCYIPFSIIFHFPYPH